MNIDYLYSIINLYLKRELDNKRTILNIRKLNDQVEINFNMKTVKDDKTTFVIPYEEFNKNINEITSRFKQELMIIDEKYNYDNASSTCYYYVLFNNGRVISFDGFSIIEMNNIRNNLYNIKINKEEIRIDDVSDKKEMVYKPRIHLQEAGFSSMATLLLMVMFFIDILVITLWIIKTFMK